MKEESIQSRLSADCGVSITLELLDSFRHKQ